MRKGRCCIQLRWTTLKCIHTTLYGINVCKRMGICSHTQINVMHKAYAVYVPNTLTNVGVRCFIRRGQIMDMVIIVQRKLPYSWYNTHTLTIRNTYAWYDRHSPNMLNVRFSYVLRTLLVKPRPQPTVLASACYLLAKTWAKFKDPFVVRTASVHNWEHTDTPWRVLCIRIFSAFK